MELVEEEVEIRLRIKQNQDESCQEKANIWNQKYAVFFQ